MAKSPKDKADTSKVDAPEEDISDTLNEDEAIEAEASVVDDAVPTDIEDAEVVEDAPADDAADDDEIESPEDESSDFDMEIVEDEVVEETFAEPEPAPAPETTIVERKGGFVPMLLGGVAAAALGYGVATYTGEQQGGDLASLIEAQSAQISDLEARLGEIPAAPDFSPIEAEIAAVGAQVSELAGTVETQFAALDARVTEVEKQPNADGTLSETAIAAYQAELDALRAEVMSAASQAEEDLAAARAEAEALEQAALAAAEAASARAAINRVATAVETGAPFADALADLADVPAALSAAADTGVATTAQLTADFPGAARAALATARSEGLTEDASGLGGFLRSQFDVRSTAPREGSDPDAVLSRAEAAIKEGRVADALAEVEALPEVARAEMTDWLARAQARSDVLDALGALSETYN